MNATVEKHRREKRAGRTEKGGGVVQSVCVLVYVLEKQRDELRSRGGRGTEKEKILTDFAVGIGGFSAGTEVRITPPAGLQSATSNRAHWSPLY